MSITSNGPEAQDNLFDKTVDHVVPSRADLRLVFPPLYAIVGVYRLLTDKLLYQPAWDKCKHGTQRGIGVGFAWVRENVETLENHCTHINLFRRRF